MQERENITLSDTNKSLSPISISLTFDVTQSVDLFLEDDPAQRDVPPFDPVESRAAVRAKGDLYAQGGGRTIYVVRATLPGRGYRLFLKLTSDPRIVRTTRVSTTIVGGYFGDMVPNPVALRPDRPWQFMGTIWRDTDGGVSFQPATTAERAALWEKLPRQKDLPAPGPTSTPPPRPVPLKE